MDEYNNPEDQHYGASDEENSEDEEAMLAALRHIGLGRGRGTINPLASTALPDLGADVTDIRRRAAAAAAAGGAVLAATETAEQEAQARYEEMKKRHQVDLNDEKNLADLEDPGLMEHMRRARQQLAAHELELARLPTVEELKKNDTAARRALSGVVTSLKTQQMDLQCACDDVLLQATNVERLAGGEKPHGYPAEGVPLHEENPLRKNMKHLAKKINESGATLGNVAAALEAFERDMTLARRSYEAVVDGLCRRLESLESVHQDVARTLEKQKSGGQ